MSLLQLFVQKFQSMRAALRQKKLPDQETVRFYYGKLSRPVILLLVVLLLFANAPTSHVVADPTPAPGPTTTAPAPSTTTEAPEPTATPSPSPQAPPAEPSGKSNAKKIDKKECGWTEIDCKFQNILIDLANQAFDVMKDMLEIFILKPGDLLQNATINTFFNLIKGVSWSLATVFLIYQCLRIYVLSLADGDRSELRKLLPKIFLIPVFMMSLPWGVEAILTLSGEFSRGFLAVPSVDQDGAAVVGFAAIYLLFMGATSSLFIVILALVFLALLAVFAFQQCLRFAELAFLVVSGPIAIMSILNQEFNLFPSWWRHLLSVAFTQSVQYLLIMMAIKLATGTNPFKGEYMGIFGSIGCMVLVIKSPAFIREFMYSTGAGSKAAGMAANTVSSAGRSLIKLIK
ncbi:conjugal transfer protein TrbL family protein [Paenibacillus sp. NPDC056579]|uniref:conjugal transfer protein TrbL family protein n=1 Tax=unclassified Paenibacillus TaxID=185978 RepID=UPI001EF89E20|nr:conjugal transfer protein TrbL family protein [Paenibacillus sp. H1-7]ULL18345.1 hypothetical protein DVH26_30105 [Paenibacillus sp. H1-7]